MAAFDHFKSKHGQPTACEPVPAVSISKFSSSLPTALLDEWRGSGWCRYGRGLFWLVNPDYFADIADDWLGDKLGMTVFARTAFGCLFLWDRSQAHFLDVITSNMLPMLDSVEELFDGMLTDEDFLVNDLRSPDFEKAVARLGILAADECYGYFPPVSMGGDGTADTLQRVKLREHLSLLAETMR